MKDWCCSLAFILSFPLFSIFYPSIYTTTGPSELHHYCKENHEFVKILPSGKRSLIPTNKVDTTILPEFKGCYDLTGEGRNLTGLAEAEIFEMNSVTKCLQICKDGGFPFAEVQGE